MGSVKEVNKVETFDEIKIAHEFNSFFTNVGKGKTWQVKFQMLLLLSNALQTNQILLWKPKHFQ